MKIITFTGAGGAPGVLWPAPDAQLAGEDDGAFIQRLSLGLPPGATNVAVIDSAAYVAPPPAPSQVATQAVGALDQNIGRMVEFLIVGLVTKGVIAVADLPLPMRAWLVARAGNRTTAGIP